VPKVEAHFDADSLIRAVHADEIGLRISTNNPRIFKATLYTAARRLELPIHIYSIPQRPNAFALLKRKLEKEAT
jgi:hypothetical protein